MTEPIIPPSISQPATSTAKLSARWRAELKLQQSTAVIGGEGKKERFELQLSLLLHISCGNSKPLTICFTKADFLIISEMPSFIANCMVALETDLHVCNNSKFLQIDRTTI